MSKAQFLLSLIFLFSSFSASAGKVEISSSVDGQAAAEVSVGETFTYIITVSSDDSVNFEAPPTPQFGDAFVLVNTFSGQSTRSSFVNGSFKSEQSRTFNYALEAVKAGSYSVPPVQLTVDGNVLSSNSVQIKVLGSSGNAQPQRRQKQPDDMMEDMDDMEQMFQQLLQRRLAPRAFGGGQQGRGGQMPQVRPTAPVNPNEAFFIQVETDKTQAYVGEQITVSFYLYTRGQITDIDTLTYPSLKGFWKEDLEMASRLNFESVDVGGQVYQRALLVSYALFPIKPGKAIIDSYKARCTVLTPSSFGFGRPYQFTKASRPVDIQVLDVPKEGRTSDYSGAVGQFKIAAQFEPASVPVNQPATLRIRFEGRGNAKLIELPNLNLPPSMELYDQKTDAKFFKDGTSYKQFEVLIIPRQAGIVELPAVRTSVFDPDTKKYEVVNSQPMRLNVLGSGVPMPVTAGPEAGSKPTARNEGPSLPGLSTDFEGSKWWSKNRKVIWSSLYLFVFSLLGFHTWRTLGRKPKRLNLQLMLKRRLKLAESHIASGDIRKLGVELTNVVYFIVGQVSEQGGANEELEKLLEKVPPSVRKELGETISNLLSQAEAMSFAPEALLKDWTKDKQLALKKEFERVMNRTIEMVDFQDPS